METHMELLSQIRRDMSFGSRPEHAVFDALTNKYDEQYGDACDAYHSGEITLDMLANRFLSIPHILNAYNELLIEVTT